MMMLDSTLDNREGDPPAPDLANGRLAQASLRLVLQLTIWGDGVVRLSYSAIKTL